MTPRGVTPQVTTASCGPWPASPRAARNMSDSLCDAVDICLTAVHNMHVRILHGREVFGWRPAMMRAMPGIAVIVAGLMLTAGCSSGASTGGSAPSTDGIGPITFAIGKDNPGWLQGVI